MPTAKPRLNITLSPELDSAVEYLAKRDKTSRSGKVAELVKLAIEIEEDMLWSKLADERASKRGRLIPHSEAWK